MSDENVVRFTGVTSLPIPVERIIDACPRDMKRILIIGIDADGGEYFASSDPDGGTALWDMERARHKLMAMADEDFE